MKIIQLLTPKTTVHWLSVADTVRDAFDHLETYELGASPMLDWNGRYVGTVTDADLRRHVAGAIDRDTALATPLAHIERRSRNAAVTVDREVDSVIEQASLHPFVPVIDDAGRFLGLVDRKRILDARLPSAA
jgi:CBS-domain-containing membrane protein